MGWCSGTQVFDGVLAPVLKSKLSKKDKILVVTTLIVALEDNDWDCQNDSEFYNHPLVRAGFDEVHPGMRDAEDAELEEENNNV